MKAVFMTTLLLAGSLAALVAAPTSSAVCVETTFAGGFCVGERPSQTVQNACHTVDDLSDLYAIACNTRLIETAEDIAFYVVDVAVGTALYVVGVAVDAAGYVIGLVWDTVDNAEQTYEQKCHWIDNQFPQFALRCQLPLP